MGITQLIDPFYEDLSPEEFKQKPTMGQLCWVLSPHLRRQRPCLFGQEMDSALPYQTVGIPRPQQ
jgi:hypothetical protein